MASVPEHKSKPWARRQCYRAAVGMLGSVLASGVACSDDADDAVVCTNGGGPVLSGPGLSGLGGGADAHCQADGMPIVQEIGQCVTSAAPEAEHAEGEEHAEEEEEHAVLNGSEADDDDCKYHVRFENTCVALNEPVTFTLSLTRKDTGQPATGAVPASPEIYFASDNHLSPSNNITAPEGPPGTYTIGPVIFDRSGRWVVRFHYFETCSDVPEDSPHGHVAFYFDVP